MNNKNNIIFNNMSYYFDRDCFCTQPLLGIANKCLENYLYLWKNYSMTPDMVTGNIFFYSFLGEDAIIKKEYLFTMDYLSILLSAYRMTQNDVYKEKFLQLFDMFIEYIDTTDHFNNKIGLDLPILGQVLVVIKAIDILGYIPSDKKIQHLFKKYADWLMDKNEWITNHNHGLMQVLAQLHLSVFMPDDYPIMTWRESAIEHVTILYEKAYYGDHINTEHSLAYFNYNNILYKSIIEFCKHYKIEGIEEINNKISYSQNALDTFAHSDKSFPVIGDGSAFYGKFSNNESRLFSESNIAVVKIDDLYLSFKNKTEFQSHAHIDISSITARYKNIDFIVDSGQYNYDKYTPINRYLRSAAGHSGIFPLFADKMFQKDFCDAISYSEITDYKHNENNSYVKGEYQLRDVKICREVHISKNEIIIKDSWKCEKPTTMRQRFIIPKDLIEHSKFTVSKRTLETKVGNNCFKFEIIPVMETAITEVQFGVAAPQYYEYQTTLLLDTYVENSASSEITSKISFWEE